LDYALSVGVLYNAVHEFVGTRAQSTVCFPIGGHVNVLSDYK